MTAATAATSNCNLAINPNYIAGGALAGGVAALIATEIAFTGGLIFGAVFFTVFPLITQGLESLGSSEVAKAIRAFASLLVSITAAVSITTLAGFSITFNSGIVLALSMLVASCAMGVCCGVCCIGGLCASFGCF